jgi:cell wall assembly regulator SMI1
MKEAWERIEKWLKENYSEGLEMLNEGASNELIQKTEKTLEIEFPEEFKNFYRIHNGVSYLWLNGWELLSLEQITGEWIALKEMLDDSVFDDLTAETQKEILSVWYNKHWIPFTCDGATNYECLDYKPTDHGRVGQIIKFWHDDDVRPLVADSFCEWVINYVEGLENGTFFYDEENDGIVSLDY